MRNRLVFSYFFGIPAGFLFFCSLFYFEFLSNLDIIFYRGLLIIFIVCVIQVSLFAVFLHGKKMPGFGFSPHAMTIGMASLAVNILFFIVLPVSLDRSISVFFLGYMMEKNEPVSRNELRAAFDEIYMDRYSAVDRRLDEQIASKNIVIKENGGFALTENGITFVKLSRLTAKIFRIEDRFVKPKITN